MTKTDCAIRFLDDLPADEDAFGSHEPVAKAIGDVIEQEEGGKAIALTGAFGSGKSTVVELLRKRFAGEKVAANTRLFVYDAWAHQGDPLRRSFLEALRDFLVSDGSIEISDFQQAFDVLTRRRQETTTDTHSTTTPVLTAAGKLMILAVFLVPAGVGLIQRVDPHHLWTLSAGLKIVAAPFLVALRTWIWWRPSLRVWRKSFWVQNRAPHEDDSVVELFWSRTRQSTQEKHQSSTSLTPEPTSIEFGELFGTLLERSLRIEGRMVIVVDNLDRLDGLGAQQVWSTMRVFFEPGGRRPDWAKKLWLIVPFDPQAIGRVWASSYELHSDQPRAVHSHSTDPPMAPRPGQIDAVVPDQAKAAVDKTFQISFRVPTPVLSDWQAFLERQMAHALPDHSEEEFLRIYLIYSHLRVPEGRPVTPRAIKLFVNKLCAMHKQYGHSIPLSTQAAYALCADGIANPYEDLVKPNLLDIRVQVLLGDPNWQLHLAALYFDVQLDKAAQVLMGENVRTALATGDSAKLQALAQVPGFAGVCEEVIHGDLLRWAAVEPRSISLAALALEQSPVYDASWSYLRYAVKQASTHSLPHPRWWPLDERVGNGLCVILHRCPQPERADFARSILRSISESSPSEKNQANRPANSSEPQEKQIEDWVRGALKVVLAVIDLLGDTPVSQEFRVPGTPQTYLRFIDAATRLVKPDVQRYFMPAASSEEIVAEIAARIEQGKPIEGAANTVEGITRIQTNCAWKPVVDAIAKKLNDTGPLNAPAIAAWLDLLLPLAMTGASREANEWLGNAAKGIILHHLQNTRSDQSAASRCLFVVLLFNPTCEVTPVGQSPQGAQAYQQLLNNAGGIVGPLLRLLLKWNKFTTLLETAGRQAAMKSLVQAISREVARRDDVELYLDDSALLSNYAFLSEALGPGPTGRLLERYAARESFILKLTQTQFAEGKATLYRCVLQANDAQPSQHFTAFLKFLRKGLQSVAKSAWREELSGFGPLLQLAIAMVQSRHEPNLGSSYQDAMIEHGRTLIDGEKAADGLAWRDLMAVLPQKKRALFIRDLRDVMLRSEEKPIAGILRIYSEPLQMYGQFAEKPDDVLRHLCKPIITRALPDELNWIEQVLRNEPQIATKAQEDARADLLERTRAVEANSGISNDVRLCAGRIADLLSRKA